MKKLLVIARKEILLRFTDRAVLLLTIAMPLLITVLVEQAFGGYVLGRGIPDRSVPVGIVNQDRGGPWGNFGAVIVQVAIPSSDEQAPLSDPLFELFAIREIESEAQARYLVEQEKLIAALLIPPDFSEALAAERATIEVYINGREQVRGVAFRSVVETLANMISSAQVTVRTTVRGLVRHPGMRARLESGSLDEALAEIALAAAMPEPYPIGVRRLKSVGTSAHLELAHYLAAALAITFTGFTALIGSASLLQENAQWTLQRMHTTPTPSGIILGGKTLGTYLNSLTQLCVLMGGLMAWQWLRANGLELEPEVSLPGLAVLALAVAAASTGVGTVIAGFSRTYAQAANYGRALLVLMGLVGGIFFPVELFPKPVALLSRLTFQYWAMDGYLKLALGGSAASIVPHVVVLVAMGSLFFVIGSRFLRRRIGFL